VKTTIVKLNIKEWLITSGKLKQDICSYWIDKLFTKNYEDELKSGYFEIETEPIKHNEKINFNKFLLPNTIGVYKIKIQHYRSMLLISIEQNNKYCRPTIEGLTNLKNVKRIFGNTITLKNIKNTPSYFVLRTSKHCKAKKTQR
jgi:hypothetical protein